MPGAVHCFGGRPRPTRMAMFVNKLRDRAKIVRGADDDTDRYFDREDIAQQIREGQCGQRIATQIGEMRVRGEFGGRDSEQSLCGLEYGLQRGLVRIDAVQRPQLGGLLLGDLGVHLF